MAVPLVPCDQTWSVALSLTNKLPHGKGFRPQHIEPQLPPIPTELRPNSTRQWSSGGSTRRASLSTPLPIRQPTARSIASRRSRAASMPLLTPAGSRAPTPAQCDEEGEQSQKLPLHQDPEALGSEILAMWRVQPPTRLDWNGKPSKVWAGKTGQLSWQTWLSMNTDAGRLEQGLKQPRPSVWYGASEGKIPPNYYETRDRPG